MLSFTKVFPKKEKECKFLSKGWVGVLPLLPIAKKSLCFKREKLLKNAWVLLKNFVKS